MPPNRVHAQKRNREDTPPNEVSNTPGVRERPIASSAQLKKQLLNITKSRQDRLRFERQMCAPSHAPPFPATLWDRVLINSSLNWERALNFQGKALKPRHKMVAKELVKYYDAQERNEIKIVEEQEQACWKISTGFAKAVGKRWSRIHATFQRQMAVDFDAVNQQSAILKQQLLIKKTEKLTQSLVDYVLERRKKSNGQGEESTMTSDVAAMFKEPDTDEKLSIYDETRLALFNSMNGKRPLRDYQRTALHWMVQLYSNGLNGILADEMGLGKTVQTIALLCHFAEHQHDWGPHLIVVPTTVVLNWKVEIMRWSPGFKVLTYIGSAGERKKLREGWSKEGSFDICVTSYNLVVRDRTVFRRKAWGFLILDEAHHIKNFSSLKWQSLYDIQAQYRLLLTGTPLQSSVMELWSLFHFLLPNASAFSSHDDFRAWYSNPMNDMVSGKAKLQEDIVRRLQTLLRPFLLRRLKKDVETQLPSKREFVIQCKLSKRQRALYDEFLNLRSTRESIALEGFHGVFGAILMLRKVCNHPDLLEERPVVSSFIQDSYHKIVFNIPRRCFQRITPIENRISMHGSLCPFAFSFVHTPSNLLYSNVHSNKNVPYVTRKEATRKGNWLSRLVVDVTYSSPLHWKTPVHCEFSTSYKVVREYYRLVQLIEDLVYPHLVQTLLALGSTGLVGSSELRDARQPYSSPADRLLFGKYVTNANSHQLTRGISLYPFLKSNILFYSRSQGNLYDRMHLLRPRRFSENTFETNPIHHHPRDFGSRSSIGHPLPVASAGSGKCTHGKWTVGHGNVQDTKFTAIYSLVEDVALKMYNFRLVPATHFALSKISSLGDANLTEAQLEQNKHYIVKSSSSFTTLKALMLKFIIYVNPVKVIPSGVARVTNQGSSNASLALLGASAPELVQSGTGCGSLLSPFHIYQKVDSIYHSLGSVGRSWLRTQREDRIKWCQSHFKDRTGIVVSDLDIKSMDDNLRGGRYLSSVPRPFYNFNLCAPVSGAFCSDALWEGPSLMSFNFPDKKMLIHDCGKLQVLSEMIPRLRQGGHRCLIFTQFSGMLDVLDKFLALKSIPSLRIDGSTKPETRQEYVDRFNRDERIAVMTLSTRSGGIGLNLTGADTVIFYDSDWNPTIDLQAQDRCHRIGQTRDVTIYRLVTENTVEERILAKARERKRLNNVVIRSGAFHETAWDKQEAAQTKQEMGDCVGSMHSSSKSLLGFFHGEDEGEEALIFDGGTAVEEAMRAAEDIDDREAMIALEKEVAETAAEENDIENNGSSDNEVSENGDDEEPGKRNTVSDQYLPRQNDTSNASSIRRQKNDCMQKSLLYNVEQVLLQLTPKCHPMKVEMIYETLVSQFSETNTSTWTDSEDTNEAGNSEDNVKVLSAQFPEIGAYLSK